MPVFLVVACLACGTEESSRQAQSLGVGARLNDEPLEKLLTPDVPLEKVGLYQDATGAVLFEAQLRDDPPAGFLDNYRQLLEKRAVELRPIASSPHAIPPRVFGWETIALRTGGKVPFNIWRTAFISRDEPSLKKGRWNAPDPIAVAGRRLTFTLGRREKPWSEQVILPTEDLFAVAELPFARFPGSVLTETYPTPDEDRTHDERMLSESGVYRTYNAIGAAMTDVLAHYRREANQLGLPAQIAVVKDAPDRVQWRGSPRNGIVGLTVTEIRVQVGGHIVEDVAHRWPHLVDGLPSGILAFRVSLTMTDSATASRYWTSEAQALRARLLAARETSK